MQAKERTFNNSMFDVKIRNQIKISKNNNSVCLKFYIPTELSVSAFVSTKPSDTH